LRRDLVLLFSSRALRLFAFGLTSVTLALFLETRGLRAAEIGLLFTLALLGDAAIGLYFTTRADRWGRRRTLMVSAILMAGAGLLLANGGGFWLLAFAATIGVVSPGGGEVGPFLPIEQAALAQVVSNRQRTGFIAWYHVTGFSATAVGAMCGGWLAERMQAGGLAPEAGYERLLWIYAAAGVVLTGIAAGLTDAIETVRGGRSALAPHWSGLHQARGIVGRLSLLFLLDSFAGGFIVQSFLAYWFTLRFGLSPLALGQVFFAANLLSGISALVAVPLARRIGLINTMVFTHLPSNLLLLLVPLMPDAQLAITMLLLRHFLSQMDVPTRQSYVMAVVPAEERSAANGITGTVRSLGAAFSPALAGLLLGASAWMNAPIFLAGGMKVIYDLLLFAQFRRVRPPEE
jgi:MFS family permease